jgi:hypothetical protein
VGISSVITATQTAAGLAANRWSAHAVGALFRARDGKLTFGDFVASWGIAVTGWIETLQAGLTSAAQPLLPVVLIVARANDALGGALSGSVDLAISFDDGVQLTASPLLHIGGQAGGQAVQQPLPLLPEIFGEDRSGVQVTIGAPASVPSQGLYQGVVLQNETIVASVTVLLT